MGLRLCRLNTKPHHGGNEKQSDLNRAQRFLHTGPTDDWSHFCRPIKALRWHSHEQPEAFGHART